MSSAVRDTDSLKGETSGRALDENARPGRTPPPTSVGPRRDRSLMCDRVGKIPSNK